MSLSASASALVRRFKNVFGNDAFDWLDRSYTIDWIVATAFWVLSGVFSSLAVYKRSFSADPPDPLIDHPHTSQQISGATNGIFALYVPCIIIGTIGGVYGSARDIHHGVLATWSSRGLARLITEFLKNRVGRLRPDFLSRCKWDSAIQECTGKADDISDGRRSFPSGHSSTAFAGMALLSLYFAGKLATFCFSAELPPASFRSSRLARLFITLTPLVYATWVAISRVEDYRHHKEDVIVGSLLGIASATMCYWAFFTNPFAINHSVPGQARIVYREFNNGRPRTDGFELSRMDDDIETV